MTTKMEKDDQLEQLFVALKDAVAPQRSNVPEIMSRVAILRIPRQRSLRWWSIAPRSPKLTASAVVAAVGLLLVGLLLFDRPTGSAFAKEAISALERAKADGVTVEEHTDMVDRDGNSHSPSTSDTFFVGRECYRRDIRDGDKLREIQWYTPDRDGMLQTSVRFDTKTYTRQTHRGKFQNENPVARMNLIVKFIDRADCPLPAKMIRGRQCPGFELRASKYGDNPQDWIDRVWFDLETKLPARIEHERPAAETNFKASVTVQEHFDWSPDLSADTFTVQIPDGFTEQK